MVAFAEGDEAPMRAVAELKADRVRARARAGGGTYLEANHAFVKGYGWFLPALLGPENLRVIYLRRAPELVAKSLVRVRGVPGRTSWSRLWYSAPGQARNLLQPCAGAGALELGRWYAEEIERQAAHYRASFPGVEVVEVTLEDLNDYAFVEDLFTRRLGLAVDTERLLAAVGRHTPDLNREFAAPPDLSDLPGLRDPDALAPEDCASLQARVRAYLRRYHGSELLFQEPGLVGDTIMTSIVRVVTGQSSALAREFRIAVPNTEFEIDLIMGLLRELRPLDPMGLLFTRCSEGGYDLPAANSDGGLWAILPVVAANAFRRSSFLRWAAAGLLSASCLALALASGAS
tara:strand:+ start:388 stop:1425 length:1038 start_codon:yes stop_codon:yes gene_type:complete